MLRILWKLGIVINLKDKMNELELKTEVECDHNFVTHMIQMPEGYHKPGATYCSKCGKFKPINQHLQSTSGLTKP